MRPAARWPLEMPSPHEGTAGSPPVKDAPCGRAAARVAARVLDRRLAPPWDRDAARARDGKEALAAWRLGLGTHDVVSCPIDTAALRGFPLEVAHQGTTADGSAHEAYHGHLPHARRRSVRPSAEIRHPSTSTRPNRRGPRAAGHPVNASSRRGGPAGVFLRHAASSGTLSPGIRRLAGVSPLRPRASRGYRCARRAQRGWLRSSRS